MKTKAEDLIGKRFGKLEVTRGSGTVNGKTVLACTCDCGGQTTAYVAHLVQGRRVSCGCHNPGRTTHGKRYTRGYQIWCDMLKRCYNSDSVSYKYYGARGITVCDRWRSSYQNFFDDMGDPPAGLSLDRINTLLGYAPGNCRWATAQMQTENRTCQQLYEYQGNKYTLPNLCKKLGINYRTMRNRLFRSGMTLEAAISTPVKERS